MSETKSRRAARESAKTTAHKSNEEEKRRAQFAAAIAKSEFGRHYWNERMATALREAGAIKKKK